MWILSFSFPNGRGKIDKPNKHERNKYEGTVKTEKQTDSWQISDLGV